MKRVPVTIETIERGEKGWLSTAYDEPVEKWCRAVIGRIPPYIAGVCTRPLRHDGDHAEHAGAMTQVCTWPQDRPAEPPILQRPDFKASHWHLIEGGVEFEDANGFFVHVFMDKPLYISLGQRMAEHYQEPQ